MQPVIKPVDRKLIRRELTAAKYIRTTRKGDNELYEVTYKDSPNIMQEIGRLREISFRLAGGGSGKDCDIDQFDTDPVDYYRQLIVWDPHDHEILGGYRYILCGGIPPEKMATSEIFRFSDGFVQDYLPFTIELGRSFIQPNYQNINVKRKGLYALDNLWDGLGALMLKYSHYKYFFGKVTMYTSYNLRARNTLLNFLHKYFGDPDELVTPIEPIDYDSGNKYYQELFKDLDYHDAYRVLQKEIKLNGELIPPLINSYMNLSPSMKVFGTAVNPGFGNVEETGILVKMEDIYPEKKKGTWLRCRKPCMPWRQDSGLNGGERFSDQEYRRIFRTDCLKESHCVRTGAELPYCHLKIRVVIYPVHRHSGIMYLECIYYLLGYSPGILTVVEIDPYPVPLGPASPVLILLHVHSLGQRIRKTHVTLQICHKTVVIHIPHHFHRIRSGRLIRNRCTECIRSLGSSAESRKCSH